MPVFLPGWNTISYTHAICNARDREDREIVNLKIDPFV